MYCIEKLSNLTIETNVNILFIYFIFTLIFQRIEIIEYPDARAYTASDISYHTIPNNTLQVPLLLQAAKQSSLNVTVDIYVSALHLCVAIHAIYIYNTHNNRISTTSGG